MASIEDVLSKLDAVSGGGQRRQWSARCPCRNDDEHPSLRVSIGTDEQILLHCRRGGGCDAETIARELGYTMQDLWPGENEVQINRRKPKMTGTKEKKTKTNTYKYYDENGILVMEVLRFVTESGKKTFQQRKPSSDGGWEWQMGDMEKPLYRLPQVLRAKERGDTIYVVEGEKDVETLESLGKTATTQPGGAGGPGQRKWMPWHTEALAGANIVQLIDNDDPGRLHARHVHDELIAAGCKVKTYAPPKQYKDVSDMVEDGGKLAELESFDVANVSLDLNVAEPEDDPNEPLFKFAAEIDDVINGSASVERRAELIRAKADNLILTVQGEQLDRGKHVNWKDFLEEEADLSYDWVIPNVLERGERVMLVASEGAGKRATITSMIPTPSGFSKLGDIAIGDQVIDRFGNPVTVTYVSPIEPNPDSYRVTFSDGSYVDCDAEHNWYTETIEEREQRKLGKVRTTAEIRDTLISSTKSGSMRNSRAKNHAIPTTKPLNLPEANLPIDPYTLGAWLGDGSSGNAGISNSIEDKQIIDEISSAGWTTRLRPSSMKEGKCPMYGILGLQERLRTHGLLGNKHIPAAYLRASYGQRLSLLQGLMDTDGTVDKRGRCEFSVTDKTLAEGVYELLLTMGIKATMQEADSKIYGRLVGKRYRLPFTTDLPVFRLERKAKRIKPLRTNRSLYRYIVSVEKIDPEPMLCISVDGPDNTYLIGEQFIPTHNTTLIRQVAMLVSAGIHPFKHNVEIPPMRTLMIDMENPERITRRTTKRIADRIKALPEHWERMDGAHLVMKPDGVNLFKAADRALIEEYVETVRPDILFFGPVYKSFIDPGGRTPEAICTDLVRFFDYIRTTYDCALWLEHHAPLGSGGQRQLRPFGSAVWSRWSEFGLAIEADPADPELIQFNHYRGQREPREWPKLCRRGVVWPYEVVEFADFNPLDGSVPDRKAQAETLADTSIDTGDNPW